MREKWMVKNKQADFCKIMEEFGVTDVIAKLLVNRGMDTAEKIRGYLYGGLESLPPASSMKDLLTACDIILRKIKENKKIRIVGDYDVDGIVSTYILYSALQEFGADVDYQIPDRIKDGYGINISIIEKAHAEQIDTILTCDNGISAAEQTAYAMRLGMTVIITDHHDVPDELPKADAVVNPKQADCLYPYKELCGAGVAYKLAAELYARHGRFEEAEQYIQFLSIAIICDVMELTGENRVIVREGIDRIRKSQNLGLHALVKTASIDQNKLNAYHLGYVLGPCFNAAGRLETADLAIRLLMAADAAEAAVLAQELYRLNQIRKEMTQKAFQRAAQMVDGSESLQEDRVLLLCLADCHESLAGIIAGRLRERYHKPCFVLTKSGTHMKGSGRSIEQYPMFQGLHACREHLLKYGGHPLAAGLSIEEEKIPVLRAELNAQCNLSAEDLIPKVSIDAVLALSGIDEKLIADLNLLEPFGRGNAKPIFADKDLEILRLQVFGKTTRTVKLQVKDRFGTCVDALYFGDADGFLADLTKAYGEEQVRLLYRGRGAGCKISFTYYPSINAYNGMRGIQVVLQNYLF